MTKQEEKSEKEKIQEVISKSGHSFHYEVVDFLRGGKNDWKVTVSPYYRDYATNKSREIDIIAEKLFPLGGNRFINVRLFIECKYIDKAVIFWFDNKNEQQARKYIADNCSVSDYKVDEHHYYKDKVAAKLFASEKDGKLDKEIFYDALNQSLTALTYYRYNYFDSLQGHDIRATINYPIILCKNFDRLYKKEVEPTGYSQISSPFQLEVNYSYLSSSRSVDEYFLIDVVGKDQFEDFLSMLEATDIQFSIAKACSDFETVRFNRRIVDNNE